MLRILSKTFSAMSQWNLLGLNKVLVVVCLSVVFFSYMGNEVYAQSGALVVAESIKINNYLFSILYFLLVQYKLNYYVPTPTQISFIYFFIRFS